MLVKNVFSKNQLIVVILKLRYLRKNQVLPRIKSITISIDLYQAELKALKPARAFYQFTNLYFSYFVG